MLLKKHIQLAFLATLILFALSFAINFWSNQKNGVAIETLQQATARQALLTTIKQGVSAMQKRIDRLGQIRLDAAMAPLAADEIEQMSLRSTAIAGQIAMLHTLSDEKIRAKVEVLQKDYSNLDASWRIFYQSFGVSHVQALTELALHSEPLSQRVLFEAIPQLEENEKLLAETAHQEFRDAQWWTAGMTSAIFILSLLAATVIAVRTYRRLARGLKTLHLGVKSISSGNIEHRIELQSGDELGEIARSLNNLSAALNTSQNRLTDLDKKLVQQHEELEVERKNSASLLRNILPASVADEFRLKGSVETKYMEDVTIIFTDFVNFSSFTEKMAAEELVKMLHEHFSAFDQIIVRYGLEKLKTIGDSYMCAGGLPERNPSHPVDSILAAMEIVRTVLDFNAQHNWSIRVGIHTGHLIAGIVGKQKFAYDIWGESVNYASRLESSSEPNRITLSEQTYARIKDFFECEKRSDIVIKGDQKSDMYFLIGILPSLTDDSKQIPPPAFLRRYRSYFQKDPPAFPGSTPT